MLRVALISYLFVQGAGRGEIERAMRGLEASHAALAVLTAQLMPQQVCGLLAGVCDMQSGPQAFFYSSYLLASVCIWMHVCLSIKELNMRCVCYFDCRLASLVLITSRGHHSCTSRRSLTIF